MIVVPHRWDAAAGDVDQTGGTVGEDLGVHGRSHEIQKILEAILWIDTTSSTMSKGDRDFGFVTMARAHG